MAADISLLAFIETSTLLDVTPVYTGISRLSTIFSRVSRDVEISWILLVTEESNATCHLPVVFPFIPGSLTITSPDLPTTPGNISLKGTCWGLVTEPSVSFHVNKSTETSAYGPVPVDTSTLSRN